MRQPYVPASKEPQNSKLVSLLLAYVITEQHNYVGVRWDH